MSAVATYGPGKWKMIAGFIQSRTPGQCQVHFYKLKQKLQLDDKQFQEYAIQYTSRLKNESTPDKPEAQEFNNEDSSVYEPFNSEWDPINMLYPRSSPLCLNRELRAM